MLYDAAILSWAYIQQQLHCKRNMQPSVHGSTIMTTKAWEQPAFSINRQMDKEDSLCLTPPHKDTVEYYSAMKRMK